MPKRRMHPLLGEVDESGPIALRNQTSVPADGQTPFVYKPDKSVETKPRKRDRIKQVAKRVIIDLAQKVIDTLNK